MPKTFKTILLTSFLLLVSQNVNASDIQSSAIKSNGELVYAQEQKKVDTLSEMFLEGDIYGRVRNNNFFFSYNTPDASHETHVVSAIGGSFVYKSAVFNGFDVNLGLYGSKSYFDDAQLDDISHLKPSKDTLSRFKYVNGGSTSVFAFGQANVNYTLSQTSFRLGRQLVETFYTRSNDTKMIPNAFDGFVVASKDIPDSAFTLAYLARQKLRDHEQNHAVLMYGDDNSTSGVNEPGWTQNDDSAMHKGLTYTALKAAGKPTHAPLIVLDFQNESVEGLKINFASYLVPELLAQAMGELNYEMDFGSFSITPGFRYLKQFDNGAGEVGGASLYLKGLSGYKNPDSLDSTLIGARLVTRFDEYKINLAYTAVSDEADLVTPWRAFSTSGYTRSMGMYNWRANVKSYRLELVHGANDEGVYKDGFIQTSVLYMDGDASKDESDSIFYYFGYVKNLQSAPEFQYRLRLGYRDFIQSSDLISSYLDSRLEFNYLF